MDPVTQNALSTAEETVRELVEQCRRGGRLVQRPRAVAQLSRTGKWHLNAISALRPALADEPEAGQQGA